MSGTPLFYLTIIVGMAVLYLIICQICETKQVCEIAKTVAKMGQVDENQLKEVINNVRK